MGKCCEVVCDRSSACLSQEQLAALNQRMRITIKAANYNLTNIDE